MSQQDGASPQIEGFDPRMIYGKGVGVESADLLVGTVLDQVVGRVAACSFCASVFMDSTGAPIFKGVTVIAPPADLWEKSADELFSLVKDGLRVLSGSTPNDSLVEYIRQRLVIARCTSLDAAELVQTLEKQRERLIIIPHADAYRHTNAVEPIYEGQASARLPADTWVPHLVAWADQYLQTIKESGNYLLLLTEQSSQMHEHHQASLVAVERLYPVFFTQSHRAKIDTIVTENAARWSSLATANRIDEVLREIEALDVPDLGIKHQLKIQALARSSYHNEMLYALRSYLDSGLEIPGEMAAKFGRSAARAGDLGLAKDLVVRGLGSVKDQKLLEVLLIEVDDLGDDELKLSVYRRLKTLFPESPQLASFKENLLISLSMTPENGKIISTLLQVDLSGFESDVMRLLGSSSSPQFDELLRTTDIQSQRQRDLAHLCCAAYASRQGVYEDAFKFAIRVSNPGPLDERACWLVIGSIRQLLLQEGARERINSLEEPFAYIRRFIATNPSPPHMREAFSHLFSVDVSANLGMPLIASQVMELVKEFVPLQPEQDDGPIASMDECEAFLERVGAWLQEIGALDVSHTRIPANVISGDPQALLNRLTAIVKEMSADSDGELLEDAEYLSFIACTLARHVPNTEADINALRMIAGYFATAGQAQKARDRAEQILEIAGESKFRRRAAWIAFADIYQRVHNPIVALVGLAQAFELRQDRSPEQLWWELYVLFRTLRDAGLYPYALDLLSNLKKLTLLLDEPEGNLERIKTMELNLRVMYRESRDEATLIQLMLEAEEHCRSILLNDRQSEVQPAIAALAQAIALLEHHGGTPSVEAKSLLDVALGDLNPHRSSYLAAMTASNPSFLEAILLNRNTTSTRNADDIPRDLKAAELSVRRLLRAPNGAIPVETVAAAVEMLADHGLDTFEGARELNGEWPLEYARQIIPDDGAVLMMALDTDGMLVSLTIDRDQAVFKRQNEFEIPLKEALSAWSKKYPLEYGYIDRDAGNNEIYLSMEQLPVPLPERQRLIVIAEPVLQQIPINIALVGGEFAGRSCATGYVPSLTWLEAKRKQSRSTDLRRVAWISEATGRGKEVLGHILMRTEYPLREHDFEIDTSPNLPPNLKGAKMAVVGAHGSLASDDKYFHRISDEGTLTISPATLARALAGTELAIVFICSGGRTDKHPLDNTAVGLPKHLLSAGCRTVIASPWPMAAIPTGTWLTSFLEGWDSGLSAMDATLQANQAVEQAYGQVPQYSWAMTVYGDALLKKE